MKPSLIIMLLALLSFSPNSRAEAATVNPDDLTWNYTLIVQKDQQNVSFSLMKDGSLAMDNWAEGETIKESILELTSKQYSYLKGRFENLFNSVQQMNLKETGSTPAYAFEKVDNSITTLLFDGQAPSVDAFIMELSLISKKPLPFSLNYAEQTVVIGAPEPESQP